MGSLKDHPGDVCQTAGIGSGFSLRMATTINQQLASQSKCLKMTVSGDVAGGGKLSNYLLLHGDDGRQVYAPSEDPHSSNDPPVLLRVWSVGAAEPAH